LLLPRLLIPNIPGWLCLIYLVSSSKNLPKTDYPPFPSTSPP
jgi:hypothetical protein